MYQNYIAYQRFFLKENIFGVRYTYPGQRFIAAENVLGSLSCQNRKMQRPAPGAGLCGFDPKGSDYLANNGTIKRATMLTTLIMGLMAGPAVSL